MKWTRLVVRPDALLRFWCISGFKPGPAYAAASGSDIFRDAALTSHVFLSDGSTHVRGDELQDLYDRFRRAAAEDASIPQRLAKHFVGVGERWVAHCLDHYTDAVTLAQITDDALATRLDEFCAKYSEYAPALYLPFPVERMYVEQFPSLLHRVAEGLHARATALISGEHPNVAPLVVQPTPTIELAIRPALEESSDRTYAERKDEALNRLARNLVAEFGAELPTSAARLAEVSAPLRAELDSVERDYAWIGQWGYPPLYTATSVEGLYNEAVVRCTAPKRRSADDSSSYGSASVAVLLAAADTSPSDRVLLEDFAYYNFYRTYRMELLIRAQYLSVPLLDEIGRRSGLTAEQLSLLTPPEMQRALTSDGGLASAAQLADERRPGWMLSADGLHADRKVVSGQSYVTRRAQFMSVLRAGENARGDADATDPAVVGGKAAGLARLKGGGFRVPDYCVLTVAGVESLERSEQHDVIQSVLEEAVGNLEGTGGLAVRSSASVEDSVRQSWAGRFDSVLNVADDARALHEAVETVIASTTSARVRAYAERVGCDPGTISMAVVVQRQIDADFAGVMNTTVATSAGPMTEIEVVRGLGDKLVDGSSSPERFAVGLTADATRTGPKLGVPDAIIDELVRLARRIEDHFGSPQDVEFAVKGDTVFLLQSRPLTGPGVVPAGDTALASEDEGLAEILSGLSGHVAARVAGTVEMPSSPDAIVRLPEGRVLVLKAATPIWDTVVFQATALVTDEGGSTSHAIRVANELGIPAVVGVRIATRTLKAGDAVVVDTTGAGNTGRVLRAS